MNKLSNIRIFLIAIFSMFVVACFALVMVHATDPSESVETVNSVHAVPNISVSDEYQMAGNEYNRRYFRYIIDENTGVVYLQVYGGGAVGVTVMLNADGAPVTREQIEK